MSSNKRKISLRARLNVETNAELLEKFRLVVGEPIEIDEDKEDQVVYHFSYCTYDNIPSYPYYEPLSIGGYGVEYVLWGAGEDEDNFYNSPKFPITEIQKYSSKMARDFGISVKDISLYCCFWYSGVDEPGF